MRRCLRPALGALILAVSMVCAAAAERPRVGLVLGGGGARGAAHIGVLEVLEQLRIPVDCIAGTSMGALVAGAWAAGVEPATMRKEMAAADWKDLFQDNPGYDDFNYRSKRLAQRYLPASETGVNAQGLRSQPGVLSGQKIKLFFNQLVHADIGERPIESLPVPLSIVATDIASGERVVMRDGSLTQAMLASMSVPGLMAPLDYGGRKLVDGGLVDNLPIREVRERCAAQVVIAVNVGSPLLKASDIGGLLSVSTQMIAILTEQNVTQSLASLNATDIYIKPNLDGLGPTDFERSAEAADRGHSAALTAAAALQRLSVDEATYTAWQATLSGPTVDRPMIDTLVIAGLKTVNPETVRRYLQQQVDQPLDTRGLNRDLLRAYGDGYYERVDYALLRQRERNVLRIMPTEKSWGPDYIRLGLNLNSSLSGGSTYSLRAAYQKTWLNSLGGELLFSGELGSDTGLATAWYQPLDPAQRFFVEAQGALRRETVPVYSGESRLSTYRDNVSRLDLVSGINIGLLGQARLGWREEQRTIRLETGFEMKPPDPLRTSGWLASVELDQLDQLYFPSRGWSVRASWFESSRQDYSRVTLGLNGAYPMGDWVLGLRASYDGSIRGELPEQDAARLGGFLNLSGFAAGQIYGDKLSYAHVRGERILGRMPLGLRGDMRVGVALEAGRVAVPLGFLNRAGTYNSLLLYAGAETSFGPVYVGLGRSSSGSANAYLFIGTP
jgi:NTE family protein